MLRPAARAVRRHEFLQKLSSDEISKMEAAARKLRSTPLAALDPDLLDQLTTWTHRAEIRAKNRRQRARAAASQAAAASSSSRSGPGWSWLWIGVAVGVVRLCAGGFNTTSYNSPSYSPPTFTMPQFDVDQWRRGLDKELAKPEDETGQPLGEATRRLRGIEIKDEETKKKLEELQRRLEKRRIANDPTMPRLPPAQDSDKRAPPSRP